MTRHGQFLIRALLAVAMAWSVPPASAQNEQPPAPPPVPAATDPVTVETVAARIKQIEAEPELDKALKTKLLDAYRLAATQLEAVAAFQAIAADLGTPPAADEPADLTTAHRTALEARQRARTASMPSGPNATPWARTPRSARWPTRTRS